MNTDQINSLIRTALKLIGSALVSHGLTATGNLLSGEAFTGLILAIVGVVASLNWHKDSTPPPKPPTTGLTVLLLIFAGLGLLFTPGCGTPQAKVYQAEGVTITSVDTAMQIWAEQVRAGKASQAQIDSVKAAYLTYYDAQRIAKAALEQWIASGTPGDQAANGTAMQAVTDAVNAVIDLVNRYRQP